MRIITGATGTAHVTSYDDGEFNLGLWGNGLIVLPNGNKLEATIVDNNTVSVKDGDLVFQGRHALISPGTTENLTISTGSVGMNRKDLIVARYELDTAKGTESLTLEVIEGTESSGTATDPAYTTGDIRTGSALAEVPLYRVNVSGITITSIEPLFETVEAMYDRLLHADELEFLGWSVPSECPVKNFKDSNGNFHQVVGRVDLRNLTWGRYNFGSATDPVYCFSVNITDRVLDGANVYNTKYPRVNDSPATQSNKTLSSTSGNTYIYIRDDSYTNVNDFKSAMNGVYLYYELATEVVIKCGNEKTTEIDNKLDKTGGTVNGMLNIEASVDGSNTALYVRSKSAYQSLIGFGTANGIVGNIGMDSNAEPIVIVPLQPVRTIHHDGNSAKVVISSSAPSDTSALWVVP